MKTGQLVGSALVVSAVVTVVAVVWPEFSLAVRDPSLHVALESAAGVVAGLAGLVAYARYRQSRLAGDVLLAVAFLMFGAVNIGFSVVPFLLVDRVPELAVWATLAGRIVAAAVFCLAAFQPRDRVCPPPVGHRMLASSLVLLFAIACGVLALGETLPHGVGDLWARGALSGVFIQHPVVAGVQLLALLLYAAAAVGFASQARHGDGLAAWLAAGSVLAATARGHFLLYPSLYSDFVYSGDWLRLGFYATVLVGTAHEVVGYWSRLADTSVLEERRRLAHELHDGLSQELALVAGQARVLARKDHSPQAELIASAAQRALDESRRAIAALTQPLGQPLHRSLAGVVEDVSARLRAEVEVILDPDVRVPPRAEEAMLRISREALTNAVKHARAAHIRVTLTGQHPPRLVVADDGIGFDPEAAAPSRSGFGLTGMAEQARAAGLSYRLNAGAGRGTLVEVEAP